MAYRGIAELLEKLRETGELAEIDATVDPVLEVSEIAHRAATPRGPAMLFRAVAGHRIPLVVNLLGSEKRIAAALEATSLAEVADRVTAALAPGRAGGWLRGLLAGPGEASSGKWGPKTVKIGACQQVIRLGADVDLNELPALRAGSLETAGTLTAAVLVMPDAASGRAALCRCDLRLVDRRHVAACWGTHEEAERILTHYGERGTRMPVAVVLGAHPALLLAAMGPWAEQIDPFWLAGLLRQAPIDMVAGRGVDLEVPAEAEFVLEGCIDAAAPRVDAGLLVTPGGHYAAAPASAAIEVGAMCHRANPILPAFVRGCEMGEEVVVARAMERVFRPLVAGAIPDLVDCDFPAFGAARHWGFVAIRKRHAGQARRVAHAVWGLCAWMFTKFLVVVDEEVDVRDVRQVFAAVAAEVDPARDLIADQGPADPWDPASAARRWATAWRSTPPGSCRRNGVGRAWGRCACRRKSAVG